MIIFGSPTFQSNVTNSSVVTLSGEEISVVDTIKFLGVHLDQSLTMKNHMKKISSHCYTLLRNIASIRKYLSQAQCELLINATITSRLDYCNSIFYGLNYHDCLGKLQRIQNQASKLILLRGRRENVPAPDRLHILHWLNIEKRIIFKLMLLTFYCSRNVAPIELSSLLVPYSFDADTQFASTYDVRYYSPRSSYGKRCFEYCAPKYWNSLPEMIRSADTVNIFKKRLKTFLFSDFTSYMNQVFMYRE